MEATNGDCFDYFPLPDGALGVVVASLWKVDDVATTLLMEEFYPNMLERDMSMGTALQNAKRTIRSMTRREAEQRADRLGIDPARLPDPLPEPGIRTLPDPQPTDQVFEHPYYWAAFVLIGADSD